MNKHSQSANRRSSFKHRNKISCKRPGKYSGQRSRLVDSYVDGHKYVFGKKAVLYGPQDQIVSVAGFLNEIGMIPVLCGTGEKTGLLESAYEECLFFELKEAGLKVERQKPLPVIYKEVKLEAGYRIDLLVENSVVVELKSVDALNDVHTAQVLTYLKLSGCKLGLLMNFNVLKLVDGLKRYKNGF